MHLFNLTTPKYWLKNTYCEGVSVGVSVAVAVGVAVADAATPVDVAVEVVAALPLTVIIT